jgi:hypothetical protein
MNRGSEESVKKDFLTSELSVAPPLFMNTSKLFSFQHNMKIEHENNLLKLMRTFFNINV